MRHRAVALGALALALSAAPAAAESVLVLGPSGTRAESEPLLPGPDAMPARATPPARAAARRTVRTELRRLRAADAIDDATYDQHLATWVDAQATLKRLKGPRFRQLRSVLATADAIAARGLLTAGRLPAVMTTVARNRQWWLCGPLVSPGTRVRFQGSHAIWQAYPGAGVQLQWLGNWGFANALFTVRTKDLELGELVDELVPLAAPRAGGIAWEYLFAFGGGAPPWVSSLAQGTALQALSRASIRLERPDLIGVAREGLGVFRTRPPAGVRQRRNAGIHYLQYSFAPSLHITNGFIQSLNGLYDFAKLANDDEGRRLFAAAEPQAQWETRKSNTGRFSLYDEKRESTMDYHKLLRQFLVGLCERTGTAVYCDTADAFLRQLRARQQAAGGGGGTQPAPRNPLPPAAPCKAA